MLSLPRMESSPFKYDLQLDLSRSNNSHVLQLELTGQNKIVLDVGCATGFLGEALVRRGCRVVGVEADPAAAAAASRVYEAVVVADLDHVDLPAALPGARFDVVIFGDVLEHLKDPDRLLGQAQTLLAKEGYAVASIPNIAHASVSLALLRGEFRYQERGLLDATHLRFFTLDSIRALFERTGYSLAAVHRSERGPFDTEVDIKPGDFPQPVVDWALRHPEARTYQFVVQARPRSPSSAAASLPRFDAKVVAVTPQGTARLDDNLVRQVQSIYEQERERVRYETQLEQKCAALEQKSAALEQKCAELEGRLRRYQNLPFMRTARWLRRKLLRLPETPS